MVFVRRYRLTVSVVTRCLHCRMNAGARSIVSALYFRHFASGKATTGSGMVEE